MQALPSPPAEAGRFDAFVGIDYSGAATADTPLSGLQVYRAVAGRAAEPVAAPGGGTRSRNWTRRAVAEWLAARMRSGERLLVGIDHNFSFPDTWFDRYHLPDWPAFLDDFEAHWPTRTAGVTVQAVREGDLAPDGVQRRRGSSDEFRLCERWTATAKSVFQFDVQGAVAKSSHGGIPWLRWLRREVGGLVAVWPFDGWDLPDAGSVVAEVYPSLVRRRFPRADLGPDAHDAYAAACWLEESVRRDALARYLGPPLTEPERLLAAKEGWILGVG